MHSTNSLEAYTVKGICRMVLWARII